MRTRYELMLSGKGGRADQLIFSYGDQQHAEERARVHGSPRDEFYILRVPGYDYSKAVVLTTFSVLGS